MLKYLSILTASLVTLSFADITKAESIYWIDDGKKNQRAALDGSNVIDLITIQSALTNLEVTDSFIYWSDGKKIQRANLDGTNVMNIATLPVDTSNLVVNRSFIYWTVYAYGVGSSIRRAALDGSNVIELAILKDEPDGWYHTYSPNSGLLTGVSRRFGSASLIYDMEVTDSFIYWTSGSYGWNIQRSNLDGSNVINLVKKGRPTSFTMTSSHIFWTDKRRIYRANLNGSNRKLILKKGLKSPSFLATDAVNSVNSNNPSGVQFGSDADYALSAGLSHP